MIEQQVFSKEGFSDNLEKALEQNNDDFNPEKHEFDKLDKDRKGNIYLQKNMGGSYSDRLVLVGLASVNNKIHSYVAQVIGQYGTSQEYVLVSVGQLKTALEEKAIKLAFNNENECVLNG